MPGLAPLFGFQSAGALSSGNAPPRKERGVVFQARETPVDSNEA
jgi:hypothetical protein